MNSIPLFENKYLKHCYNTPKNKVKDFTPWYENNRDIAFKKALKITKLLLNANRQIVYILSKYEYLNSDLQRKAKKVGEGKNVIILLKRTIENNFLLKNIENIYTDLSSSNFEYYPKKYSINKKKKSKTLIDEKDLLRLASLFNSIKKNKNLLDITTREYLKLNSRLYRNIHSFQEFEDLRWRLDWINNEYTEIFKKYGFMF